MKNIKILIGLTMVLAAFIASAADINLAWDASISPGITNYQLYASTNGIPSTNYTAQLNVGTNLTCSVRELKQGTWYFAVVAMKDGISSDFSNIVIAEVPYASGSFRTVVLQFSGTLTNFYDVGFFKLRIP